MTKKLKVFILAAIIFVLLAVFFSVSLYLIYTTNLWQKLPEPYKAQVAFSKLEMLSYEMICHENCMLEKHGYKMIVADFLAKEPIMGEQVSDYLNKSEEDVNSQMKIDLIGVAKMAEESKKRKDSSYEMVIPEYLIEYLNKPNVDMDAKRQILASFDQQIGASSWVIDGLLTIIRDEKKSIDERIPAIWDLANIASEADDDGSPRYGSISYAEVCELMIDLAENKDNDDSLRASALNKMYACTKFPGNYTLGLFERVKKIFENREEHLGIRDEALTQLKTYDDVLKSVIQNFMEKVYNDKREHEYIRFGAWAFFKVREIDIYREPYIDEEVFDGYLNETNQVGYTRKSY